MADKLWKFAIDVGGTFCDVVARDPSGNAANHKILSTGRTRGSTNSGSTRSAIIDPLRRSDSDGFWNGYRIELLDADSGVVHRTSITHFDSATGTLTLESPTPIDLPESTPYELFSHEEAPIVAIRYLMGLGLDDPVAPCNLRLGTTRATNALLERRGARTALIITQGFADLLLIGDQDRPRLFELNIQKPAPLFEAVVELSERIDARGNVLVPLDHADTRDKLADLKARGIDSVAICLINAYRNPTHEQAAARIAGVAGFAQVSVSTAGPSGSPTQRIVPRAETCVLDAYLSPVFREYLRTICDSLPGAFVRLMTGAGGLVGVDGFSGPAAMMSGPAGGVVACAHIARSAEFDRAIGFDMGGTSTDVSRFDGEFEYQFETRKAGVRVVAPMLAIETVAAGGGSICTFDGQRLQVGPRSAGADPGPASYGRGGPLTLTDVNLHLGRIRPEHFPFALNRNAVEKRLTELAEQIEAAGVDKMSHDEIAEGLVEIANANMAAPIKRITIAKGIDVRDHVLVCFGGAGAQHACAIARSLGMTNVLLPPLAGLFSAYGISLADVKRFAEQPVHEILTNSLAHKIETQFQQMERDLTDKIEAQGVPADRIRCARLLDARYVGEGASLTIPAGRIDTVKKRFEELHQRRYGYLQADREIEIVAARVEAVGRTDKPQPRSVQPTLRTNRSTRTISARFDARRVETALVSRSDLAPGDSLNGPAIITEETSTIVIEPGWHVDVTTTGAILLTDIGHEHSSDRTHSATSTQADPVRLELFHNHFAAIAEQMGAALRRTALSTNVKERLDFSCAVFSADGELVANAPHIPVHLGSMAACVKAVLADIPDLQSGDVVVSNDPYRGGTHLPDVTVVTPVFIEGRLLFFVASRAHHAEIGGVSPGSMPPLATNLAEEGVLIRSFKIVEQGRQRFDKLRAMLTAPPYPSRSPDENIADIVAQIAANHTGQTALHELINEHGDNVVSAYMRHVRDAAERKMRTAIANLPDGTFNFAQSLDDGARIEVEITVRGDHATVDFTGTADVHPGNFNANTAIVTSAVLYCFRCLIDQDIPLNGGVLAPIEIVVPTCMLNPPAHPDPAQCPAVSAGNVETSQRIVDCIFGALNVVAASQGTMNNLLLGNEHFAYYETICGGAGAGPDFHGASAVHTHMTNTRLTDPEILEARCPVRVVRFAVRRGSGGPGQFRGGDGVLRELEFLEPLELSLITQRRTTSPYGLQGGHDGARGRNTLKRAPSPKRQRTPGVSKSQVLPPVTHLQVGPGDRLIIETPGGGGFGPPITDV